VLPRSALGGRRIGLKSLAGARCGVGAGDSAQTRARRHMVARRTGRRRQTWNGFDRRPSAGVGTGLRQRRRI